MDIENFRQYCLAKTGTTEGFPFGGGTLVFKVMGKMFAATNISGEAYTVNLKCEPAYALELREKHPEIQPGYHMNKKHWNTIDFEGSLSSELLCQLIDHSYERVVKGLPRKLRDQLA